MGLKSAMSTFSERFDRKPFDASIFGHPLATRTSWLPQAKGGSRFKTRSLKLVSNSELHYVGSVQGKLLAAVCIVLPLLFIANAAYELRSEAWHPVFLVFVAIPAVAIGFGLNILRKTRKTLVIDGAAGLFHKGKKAEVSPLGPVEGAHSFELERVQALQLLHKYLHAYGKLNYTSYELNFVFEDGSRYNLVDHAKRSSIEKDAKVLADLLKIPLWNKASNTTYVPEGVAAHQADS